MNLENALKVLVLDKRISAWLAENDPKALKQAQEALNEYDIEVTGDVKWSSEERQKEVEGRIISDVELALLMPFYDQDKKRGWKYRQLLNGALAMYK